MKILSEARAAQLLEYAKSPQEHLYIMCIKCSNSYLTGNGGYSDCPRCTEQPPSLHELQHDPDTWPGYKFIWNRLHNIWEPIERLVLCNREVCEEVMGEIGSGWLDRYQGMTLEAAVLQELQRRRSNTDSELTADPDRIASSRLWSGVLVRAKLNGKWDHVDLAHLDFNSLQKWIESDSARAGRTLMLMLGHAKL